jgi:hypothetical protein
MVFTDIDKQTMQVLSTLVKLSFDTDANPEDIIKVGQHLGVPKDDTRELFEEWDEHDTMHLTTEEEKERFVKMVFEYMDEDFTPTKSEQRLYHQVVDYLGLKDGSVN